MEEGKWEYDEAEYLKNLKALQGKSQAVRSYTVGELQMIKEFIDEYYEEKLAGKQKLNTNRKNYELLERAIDSPKIKASYLATLYNYERIASSEVDLSNKTTIVSEFNSNILDILYAFIQRYRAQKINTLSEAELSAIYDDIENSASNYDFIETERKCLSAIDKCTDSGNYAYLHRFKFLYGRTLYDNEKFSTARDVLKEAIELIRNSTEEVAYDLNAYTFMLTLSELGLGNFRAAKASAQECYGNAITSSQNIQAANANYLLAQVARGERRFNDAIGYCDQGIALLERDKDSISVDDTKRWKQAFGACIFTKSEALTSLGRIDEARVLAKMTFGTWKEIDARKPMVIAALNILELALHDGEFDGHEMPEDYNEYFDTIRNHCTSSKDYLGLSEAHRLTVELAVRRSTKFPTDYYKASYSELSGLYDPIPLAQFIRKTDHLLLEHKETKLAEEALSELLRIAEEFDVAYFKHHALLGLAQNEHAKNNQPKKTEYLTRLLREINSALEIDVGPSERLALLETKCSIHSLNNETRDILAVSQQCLTISESLNDIKKTIDLLLVISGIYVQEKMYEKAIDGWIRIERLAQGTSFYREKFIVKVNLCTYYWSTGNATKARFYFEEASFLNGNHCLKEDEAIRHLGAHVNVQKSIGRKGSKSFKALIEELYASLEKNSGNKDGLISYWYYRNEKILLQNIHNDFQIKILLPYNLPVVRGLKERISWFTDLFLVLPTESFSEHVFDFFPFPFSDPLKNDTDRILVVEVPYTHEEFDAAPEDCLLKIIHNIQNVLNKPTSEDYMILPNLPIENEQYALDAGKSFLCGNRLPLPQSAYKVFEEYTCERFLSERIFILSQRKSAALEEVSFNFDLSYQLNAIPLYLAEDAEKIDLHHVGSIDLELPMLPLDNRSKMNYTRTLLMSLIGIRKEKVLSTLAKLKIVIEHLTPSNHPTFTVVLSVVELDIFDKKVCYPYFSVGQWESNSQLFGL